MPPAPSWTGAWPPGTRRRDRQPRRGPGPRRRRHRDLPAARRRTRGAGVRAPVGHARRPPAGPVDGPVAGRDAGRDAPVAAGDGARWRVRPRPAEPADLLRARRRLFAFWLGRLENAWHRRTDVVPGSSTRPPSEYVGRFSVDTVVFDTAGAAAARRHARRGQRDGRFRLPLSLRGAPRRRRRAPDRASAREQRAPPAVRQRPAVPDGLCVARRSPFQTAGSRHRHAPPLRTGDKHARGHSHRDQEPRVPGGHHPGRRARTRRGAGTTSSSRAVPAPARPSPTRTTRRRRRILAPPTRCGGRGSPVQGQGADRPRVLPDAPGPGAVHLPASRGLAGVHRGAPRAGTTAIAYETVQLADGSLPLLAPMSEVAGRLATQAGAYHLMRGRRRPRRAAGRRPRGAPAKVVVHRRRRRGKNAARGRPRHGGGGAVLDLNIARLREAGRAVRRRCAGLTSNTYEIEQARARCGSRHRVGTGAGRQGADAGPQRRWWSG